MACTRASCAEDQGMEQRSAASQRRSPNLCRHRFLHRHLPPPPPPSTFRRHFRSTSQCRSKVRLCLCLASEPRVKESQQIMESLLPSLPYVLHLRCRLLFSRPAVLKGCTGPRPLLPIHPIHRGHHQFQQPRSTSRSGCRATSSRSRTSARRLLQKLVRLFCGEV